MNDWQTLAFIGGFLISISAYERAASEYHNYSCDGRSFVSARSNCSIIESVPPNMAIGFAGLLIMGGALYCGRRKKDNNPRRVSSKYQRR
jgi:hypothetical protein